jgi:pyrroloquinoline quinone (PQQ) biosynthesis protein C
MPTLKELENIAQWLTNHTEDIHAVVEFRKYLFNYVSGLTNSKQLKQAIAKTRDYLWLTQLLADFFNDYE